MVRYSLRNLSKMHLKQFIQDQGYHNSQEDAQVTMDLLRFKVQEDEKLNA